MPKKRILSLILCLIMLGSCLPGSFVFADNGGKNERTVYLHAQGENPTDTPDVSTVYMGENADIYLAIDNPNKGLYENGEHKEPQYDLNGYTVTIYFDPAYFDYASDTKKPIDYTVPDKTTDTSQTGKDDEQGKPVEVPTEVGYYPYAQGSGTENGYKTAYVTVFYNGGFAPQKKDGQLWYNLCKLSLTPLKTGSTQIFIDTSGEQGKGLELFAKNKSEKLEEQTFLYTAVNGGSHTVVIKDKSRPAAPVANPNAGSYDEKQDITLSTKTTGAKIFYTLDGSDPKTNGIEYSGVITVAKDTTVKAVAYYDGIYSDVSSFYYLFTAKDDFGVDAFYPSGVYEGSVNVTLTANNPENKIEYSTDGGNTWQNYENTLVIDKDTQILARAVDKDDNKGDIYTFTYKIKPLPPVFAPESTQFTNADEITVFCVESKPETTSRFKLFYTLDGSDPITSSARFEADDVSDSAEITITKYTVIKAVVLKDGVTYSSVVTHSYDIL